MTCEQIAELLPDYLQEGLAADQRNLVEGHLQSCQQCREEVALWQKLALLTEEQPGPGLRPRFNAMLDAYQEGRWEHSQPAKQKSGARWGFFGGGWLRMPAVGLAWAILLLVVGFLAGRSLSPSNPTDQQMAKLQEELTNTRQLVTLSLLQQRSASERLQAIAQSDQPLDQLRVPLDQHDLARAARSQFEPERASAGKQVEATQRFEAGVPVRQPVEERLAHPVGSRAQLRAIRDRDQCAAIAAADDPDPIRCVGQAGRRNRGRLCV
jgi:hypothetical protein